MELLTPNYWDYWELLEDIRRHQWDSCVFKGSEERSGDMNGYGIVNLNWATSVLSQLTIYIFLVIIHCSHIYFEI